MGIQEVISFLPGEIGRKCNVAAFLFATLCLFFAFMLFPAAVEAVYDPPHTEPSGVFCADCHGESVVGESPFWTDNKADSAYNSLCLTRCHTLDKVPPYNSSSAPPAISHAPGGTVIKCTVCHHNHEQEQIYTGVGAINRDSFFLATGTAASAVYDGGSDTTEITYSALNATGDWAADPTLLAAKSGLGRGALFIPNRNNRRRSQLFMVTAIDGSTITVKGNATTTTDFAIIYGQLVRGEVDYVTDPPVATMPAKVTFYDRTGANGFVSNTAPYDGMCQVCHENTAYWLHDGTGTAHNSGSDCMRCHPHTNGFLHGGSGGGNCEECHGHDAGTNYDPDLTAPYTAGVTPSQGKKSFQSHSTHTEKDSDDVKGPGIYCDTCHDIANLPYFKSGTGSAPYDLAETDVCNNCHSPGGTYDGVNDGTFGAKENWDTGVYSGNSLKPGKEKWCVGCHDDAPANSRSDGSGVSAPNIGGDGTYGYWISGHGRTPNKFPQFPGGVPCDECHRLNKRHIDHDARSFAVYEIPYPPEATVAYTIGYRLRTDNVLEVPRVDSSNYDFCLRCHPETFTGLSNFRDVSENSNQLHTRHMSYSGSFQMWDSDADNVLGYGGVEGDSGVSCPSCHNIHGTRMDLDTNFADEVYDYVPNPVMVRDGQLNYGPGHYFRWLDGAGNPVADISDSVGGQIYVIKPMCTASCHATYPYYSRIPNDLSNQAEIAIVNVWTSDTSNNPKTDFQLGETVRIHADISLSGPDVAYDVQADNADLTSRIVQYDPPGKLWSKPLNMASAVQRAPNPPEDPVYEDFRVWDKVIDNSPPDNPPLAVPGVAEINVHMHMSYEGFLDEDTYTTTINIVSPGTTAFALKATEYSADEYSGSVEISVARTGDSSGAVGVSYGTSDGTATAPEDYTAVSGILSWGDGDTADKTFTIDIIDDAEYEGDKTVNIALSAPTGGAVLGEPDTAVLNIIENEIYTPVTQLAWSGYQNNGSETTATGSFEYTIGDGSNRFFLVVMGTVHRTVDATCEAGTPTVSYGGIPLAQFLNGSGSPEINLWMGYLDEGQISARNGDTITYDNDSACWERTFVLVSSYENVNQASPFVDSDYVYSGDAVSLITKSFAMDQSNMPFYAFLHNMRGAGSHTTPADFTQDDFRTKTGGTSEYQGSISTGHKTDVSTSTSGTVTVGSTVSNESAALVGVILRAIGN